MQNRFYSNLVELLSGNSILKAEFTFANATSILTSAAHGFVNGDVVRLSNSGGALPNGLLSTIDYFVYVIDADTLYLYTDSEFNTLATAADDGTGTHSISAIIRKVNVKDFIHILVAINTSDSAALNIKCVGTLNDEDINFSDASDKDNPWAYIQMKKLDDGSSVNGSTGLTLNGTDINEIYEINVNALSQLSFNLSSVTAGKMRIAFVGFTNS